VRRAPFPVRTAVLVAMEAWADAGLATWPGPADRVGLVVAGHNLSDRYSDQQRTTMTRNPAYLSARYALHGQDTDHVSTISHVLGIGGEGATVGGASATGNVGIIQGSRMVESGAADVCVVVGALADLSAMQVQGYRNIGALAPWDGGVPGVPFDEGHRGFVYGQGCGCLVLESARSARSRGAPVHAELGGYCLGLDGTTSPEPSVAGEARVMANAIRRAGLAPGDVDYVNTHGTAAPVGDRGELSALRQVLGAHFGKPWVNATKGMTGHCLTAAGLVEAVATVVQLREGFVHPNPELARPIDARCRFVGAEAVPTELRVALSNGFGFGGFNSSVLLRQSVTARYPADSR
jgi:malonyl-ACP decarboxylase